MVGDVLEPAIAEIAEQQHSLVIRKASRPSLQGLYRSVDRQDVQPAVVIEVEPGGSESGVTEGGGPELRTGTLVFEHSGAVIDIKVGTLAGQLCHDEVFVTIVVEIAGVHAHAGFGLAVRRQRGA